mgnify:CR=1 FL=1
MPRWLTVVVAMAAGLLIGLGQAPMGVWPATMVGIAAMTWLLAGRTPRQAAGYGSVIGLAMNALTISWVALLGSSIGSPIVGGLVVVALVAFMSVWFALLGAVLPLLLRLPGWPAWVAAAWVAMEFLSGSVPFGGFAWTRLAYTTVDQPLGGWLPYLGVSGVAFLVALGSQLLLVAASRPRRVAALGAVGVLFLGGGALRLVPVDTPEETARVTVVQPNVNREEKGTPNYARAVTNNAFSQTILATAAHRARGEEPPDFVVWPENATDTDPYRDEATRRQVELSAAIAATPVLVGAVTLGDAPQTRATSAIWWDPELGPTARYDKRNLVPFGEWIPFRDALLPLFPVLRHAGYQSIPGESPGAIATPTLRWPDLVTGVVICFELAYDRTVYDTVLHGAQLVVSQSNTNTYAGSMQIHQQLTINRVRAMELRREVLASTLNSTTALIGTSGEVHQPTAEFQAASRSFEMPLRENLTLAVRLSRPFAALATLATAVGLVAAVVLRRRRDSAASKASNMERSFTSSGGTTP